MEDKDFGHIIFGHDGAADLLSAADSVHLFLSTEIISYPSFDPEPH